MLIVWYCHHLTFTGYHVVIEIYRMEKSLSCGVDIRQVGHDVMCAYVPISTCWCKKDVTSLLMHWSYALTHRYVVRKHMKRNVTDLLILEGKKTARSLGFNCSSDFSIVSITSISISLLLKSWGTEYYAYGKLRVACDDAIWHHTPGTCFTNG